MFKTLSSVVQYQNPWITVHEDIIERPSGENGLYGVIEKADFSAILAIEDGYIHLVEQYRYPIKQRSLELPMGGWPANEQGCFSELALAELQQETGFQAKHIEQLGTHYVDKGTSTQCCHIFLATGLSFVGKSLEPEEEDMTSTTLSLAEFEEKIVKGDIVDACTIACYAIAKLKSKI